MPMISLQISQELMEKFDNIQRELNFSSRSEALREAILAFLQQNNDKIDHSGHNIATITVTHPVREDIMNQFSDIIENYDQLIKSIYEYNIKNAIVKVLMVAGDGNEIDDLYKKFTTERYFTAFMSYILIPNLEVAEDSNDEKTEENDTSADKL